MRAIKLIGAAAFIAVVSMLSFGAQAERAYRNEDVEFEKIALTHNDFTCEDSQCITKPRRADQSFTALALESIENTKLSVRIFDVDRWLDWINVEVENDARDEKGNGYHILAVKRGLSFQLKTDQPTEVRATLLSVPRAVDSQRVRMATDNNQSVRLVERGEWLDGSIELAAAQRDELWKSEYQNVKKIIVHHSATAVRDITNDGIINESDYREAVRAIYSYHTYSHKWGDIGYNYVIDPLGTIWEGRAGGDGVAGGHVYRSAQCTRFAVRNMSLNQGTMGIAVLGTYNDYSIAPEARASLIELLARKSYEFGFAPAGSGLFVDGTYPNVMGHRELDCTSCPGNALTYDLSSIITEAQEFYEQMAHENPPHYGAKRFVMGPQKISLKKGETKTIDVAYWNTGTMPWRNYGEQSLLLAGADIKKHLASLGGVRMASDEPIQDFSSALRATLTSPNVMPDRIGTFRLAVSDPGNELISNPPLVLVLGRQGWIQDTDTAIEIENTGLEWAATLVEGQPRVVTDEPKQRATIKFLNRGMREWKRGEVALHILSKDIADASWKTATGKFFFEEESVKPGDVATFVFAVHPKVIGRMASGIELRADVAQLSGSNYIPLEFDVKPAFAAAIISHTIPSAEFANGKRTVSVALKNTGAKPWSGVQLSVLGAKVKIPNTAPGGAITVRFSVRMLAKTGMHSYALSVVQGSRTILIETRDGFVNTINGSIRIDARAK